MRQVGRRRLKMEEREGWADQKEAETVWQELRGRDGDDEENEVEGRRC